MNKCEKSLKKILSTMKLDQKSQKIIAERRAHRNDKSGSLRESANMSALPFSQIPDRETLRRADRGTDTANNVEGDD
jgi:DNA-directed RNA polymerase sigma subunit (sigma70/sigma32)